MDSLRKSMKIKEILREIDDKSTISLGESTVSLKTSMKTYEILKEIYGILKETTQGSRAQDTWPGCHPRLQGSGSLKKKKMGWPARLAVFLFFLLADCVGKKEKTKNRLASCPAGQPASYPSGWPAGKLASWLSGQLAGWLARWLAGRLGSWPG